MIDYARRQRYGSFSARFSHFPFAGNARSEG